MCALQVFVVIMVLLFAYSQDYHRVMFLCPSKPTPHKPNVAAVCFVLPRFEHPAGWNVPITSLSYYYSLLLFPYSQDYHRILFCGHRSRRHRSLT